jgi:hypothetical protein
VHPALAVQPGENLREPQQDPDTGFCGGRRWIGKGQMEAVEAAWTGLQQEPARESRHNDSDNCGTSLDEVHTPGETQHRFASHPAGVKTNEPRTDRSEFSDVSNPPRIDDWLPVTLVYESSPIPDLMKFANRSPLVERRVNDVPPVLSTLDLHENSLVS